VIIASPLLLLYSLTYVLVGRPYGWREWAALPMADPGGFGLLTVIALLLTIALGVDYWRKQRRARAGR
jgi:hypothetical protein